MLKKIEEDIIRLIKENASLKEEIEKKEGKHHEDFKSFLLNILEVLDDLDRKFINIGSKIEKADEQTRIWINYFKSTRKLLGKILKTWGVVEIDSLGMKALPGYHFTVDVVTRKGLEEETIVEELTKGYLWKNEILRKAEVITVKNQ
jgi:molecular chaperone GrpE